MSQPFSLDAPMDDEKIDVATGRRPVYNLQVDLSPKLSSTTILPAPTTPTAYPYLIRRNSSGSPRLRHVEPPYPLTPVSLVRRQSSSTSVTQRPILNVDILEQVFSCLDLLTLIRSCRAVCKTWYDCSHHQLSLENKVLQCTSHKHTHWSTLLSAIPVPSIYGITSIKLRGDTHRNSDGLHAEHDPHASSVLRQLAPTLQSVHIECNCNNVHCQRWLYCFAQSTSIVNLTYKRCFCAHDPPVSPSQQLLQLPTNLQRLDIDMISLKGLTASLRLDGSVQLRELRMSNIVIISDALQFGSHFADSLHELHLSTRAEAVYDLPVTDKLPTLPNLHILILHNLRPALHQSAIYRCFIYQQHELQYLKVLAFDTLPPLTMSEHEALTYSFNNLHAVGIEAAVDDDLALLLAERCPKLQLVSAHNIGQTTLQKMQSVRPSLQHALPFAWPNEAAVRELLPCQQCQQQRTKVQC